MADVNPRHQGSTRPHWIGLGVILMICVIILWLAPEEATLGSGIQSVYVHVAFIWVGIAGFMVAGLLGAGLLITGKDRLFSWMQTIGWVGVGFFAAGVAMSILSSQITWGAVFWQEPRLRSSSTTLAMAAIVMVVIGWLPSLRARGALMTTIPIMQYWLNARTERVLHPENPILISDSLAIQATFIGLSLCVALAAGLIVWIRQQRKPAG